MTTTRQAARALRATGHPVRVGPPPHGDMSRFQIYGQHGRAVVLNVHTHSVLGMGCFTHPLYEKTKADLRAEAVALLDAAGIPYVLSRTPDQVFLSGYWPTHDPHYGPRPDGWAE